MDIDLKEVQEAAQQELFEEKFRAAVDAEKEKLRNKKSIWDRLFPYKIIIVKR